MFSNFCSGTVKKESNIKLIDAMLGKDIDANGIKLVIFRM
jgi:hypothetical protein